jgi:hypothetical protein
LIVEKQIFAFGETTKIAYLLAKQQTLNIKKALHHNLIRSASFPSSLARNHGATSNL